MDPHYLQAMMHGEISNKKSDKTKTKKSQFEIDLDKQIDDYVDGLELEEDPNHKSLQSPKARREAIKLEIKEAVKLPELSKNLESAVAILFSEGAAYLSHEAYETLTTDFNTASAALANIKIEDSANVNLQELTKITDESMKSIVEIAIAKFTEERYPDCLALFSLLTILNPVYSEYWFRLGLAAQKCDDFELASRAYAAALEFDPNLIGARLFNAECLTQRKLLDEARAEIAAAKKIANENKVDQMWIDLIPTIESSIK